MRKAKVIFSMAGMIMLSFCTISLEAAENDFSGVWVLDKAKTHALPHAIKGYTLTVTQNELQFVVETKVNGGLQAPAGGVSAPEGGWAVPGHKTGGSIVDPGGAGMGGYFGGLANNGMANGGSAAGGLALWLVNPKVTYSLDGKETTIPSPGIGNVTIKLKAKWGKDGKTLDLSFVEMAAGGHSAMLTIKERWTPSEGGEGLKIQRSVATPDGAETVVLILRKEQGVPRTP